MEHFQMPAMEVDDVKALLEDTAPSVEGVGEGRAGPFRGDGGAEQYGAAGVALREITGHRFPSSLIDVFDHVDGSLRLVDHALAGAAEQFTDLVACVACAREGVFEFAGE